LKDQLKRVAKRLASGLLAGALALGGLAISGGSVTAKTPVSQTTNRLSGADRYETAAALARDMATLAAPTGGLVIASGESPYDALAGAVLTSATRPVLLVKKDSIPSSVADFIADFKTTFRDNTPTVYVLGGESAISAATLTAIRDAVTTAGDVTPPTVTRISGADRYATAKAISDVAGVTTAGDRLIIVNGENNKWADALSAGQLSAELGWPIVLTTSTGLEASAKAKIDAYLALGGSSKTFTIIGGTSVVPSSLEEYLIITKGVAPANIDRVFGADRYETNVEVAEYAAGSNAGGSPSPASRALSGFAYSNIALVSGESPWDALSASAWSATRNATLLMTPAAGNSGLATFAAVASILKYFGYPQNETLWIIGGRTAVSDVAKATYVAGATSVNLTSTMICGTKTTNASLAGANTPAATLIFSGRLSPAESASLLGATTSAILNGTTALTHTMTDLGAITNGGTTRQTYIVSLPASTTVGTTISFGGISEGVAFGALPAAEVTRSVGSSSCTYANDTTVPSVTMTATPGTDQVNGATTSAGVRLYVTSNEAISILKNDSLVSVRIAGVDTAITNSALTTVTALNAPTYTRYMIQLPTVGAMPPGAAVTAGTVFTLNSANIKDAAELSPAANVPATAAADSTGATVTFRDISVTDSAQTIIQHTPLIFTAVSFANSGSVYGAKGTAYSLTVTTQRGLVQPSIAVDDTAKTIRITADTGYHTVADIQNLVERAGEDADWTVTSTGLTSLTLNPTIVPASCTTTGGTCGEYHVTMRLSSTEPITLNTSGVTVSVNGLTTGFVGATAVASSDSWTAGKNSATNAGLTKTITFTSKQVGSGTVALANGDNGAVDQAGNRTTTPITFTLS